MSTLAQKKCVPCEGGAKPLDQKTAFNLVGLLDGWRLFSKKIVKNFKFKDFKEAMVFVNRVARVAEGEGHHPDIFISWNVVKITLWTHAIDGLSENDFIIAAKVDEL